MASNNTGGVQGNDRQVRPHMQSTIYHNYFSSCTVLIHYRQSNVDLFGPVLRTRSCTIDSIRYDRYNELPTRCYRSDHVSLDKLSSFVLYAFGFVLDFQKVELGYIQSPPPALASTQRDVYHNIVSEETLHNALDGLFMTAQRIRDRPILNLHLWDTIPAAPVYPRFTRARRTLGRTQPLGFQPSVGQNNQLPDPALHLPQKHPSPELQQHTDVHFDVADMLKNISRPRDAIHPEDFETLEDYNLACGIEAEHQKDDTLAQMQDAWDSDRCMHFDKHIWTKVCKFFHHDEKLRQPEYVVSVYKFKRKLLPVQAHAVWHILTRVHDEGIGSVIVGHVMGIGKTTMAFCVHHIQHLLNLMWAHIKQNPQSHVNQMSSDHTDIQQNCLINTYMRGTFGFDCPCAAGSPTRFIPEKLGTSVALLPLGLLDVWTAEHKLCFGTPPPDVKGKTRQPDIQYLARAHNSTTGLTMHDRDHLCGQKFHYRSSNDEQQLLVYKPVLQNSSIFVITTSDSFQTGFIEPNTQKISWSFQPPAKLLPARGNLPERWKDQPVEKKSQGALTAIIKFLFQDEFHLRRSQANNAILQAMLSHNKGPYMSGSLRPNQPFFRIALIPMSGTPIMTGPKDIELHVKHMVLPSWNKHKVLKHWQDNELKIYGDNWEKYCKNPQSEALVAAISHIHTDLSPLVEELSIRFTMQSKFLDQVPVRTPINRYLEVECSHGPEWDKVAADHNRAEIQQFEAREKARKEKYLAQYHNLDNYSPMKNNSANVFYRSRVGAFAPMLLTLVDDTTKELLRLTNKELFANTQGADPLWKEMTASDPYWTNRKKIFESSGKLRAIADMLKSFDTPDAEGKPPRHIFITCFAVVAYVIKLWMKDELKIDNEDIIYIHSNMSTKERSSALDRFHIDVNASLKGQHTARYIIATSAAITTGVTLAEAMTVSFIEPDFHAHTMAQGWARHCRQGNKNKIVWSNLFLAQGNEVEMRIIGNSKLRAKIQEVQTRKVDGAKAV